MKRLLIVLALAFAISSPTLAGDMPISLRAPLPQSDVGEGGHRAEAGDISDERKLWIRSLRQRSRLY